MKAITKCAVKVEGDQVTITGTLADFTPAIMQSQRVTVLHHVSTNPKRPRHLQLATEGFMVKRKGAPGFCFPKTELVFIGVSIDKQLTDAPKLDKPLGADLAPTFKTELPADMAWHESSDAGKTWQQVESPSKKPGTLVKAVAANAAGSTESNIHQFPVEEAKS